MGRSILLLWGIGGSVLGLVTGLLGHKSILICTEAVERTVHKHMVDQLRYLGDSDEEISRTIREIQEQEQGHLDFAVESRGRKGVLGQALDILVVATTEILLWLSTQGDSVRLARQLSAHATSDIRPLG